MKFSLLVLLTVVLGLRPATAQHVDVLRSTSALPAHIAGMFLEPSNFQQSESGEYFVFDRRAHAVYRIDAKTTAALKLVEVGHEEGRLIEPSAFALGPSGFFVVADAPNMRERVQLFWRDGQRVSGFTLPGRGVPRLRIAGVVLNGIGTLQYIGDSLLINLPETNALVTEYRMSGRALRNFGALRRTGYEDDRDVHLGLNSGLPLASQDGTFYFVFQGGVPIFHKYDADGQLLFERHVEGQELDGIIRRLPTTWERQTVDTGHVLPVIPPTVRTAAVDGEGNLWIALTVPYTYVYDSRGNKIRTVQFRGAGLVTPTSMFFSQSGRLLITPDGYEFTLN